MKLIAPFFLILFVAFLSTPTIVKLIEKTTDKTVFFSVSEEEQVKKEVKSLFYFVATSTTFELETTTKRTVIPFQNFFEHNNVLRKIFLPPPDLV